MLSLEPWILMIAHVVPRPAVKSALLDVRDVVRNEIVPEIVALIDGTPQLAGSRLNRDAYGIANARRVDLHEFAFGCVFENVCAVMLAGVCVGIIHV